MFGRKETGKNRNNSRGNYTNVIVKHRIQKFYRVVLLLIIIALIDAIAWILYALLLAAAFKFKRLHPIVIILAGAVFGIVTGGMR